MTRGQRNNNPLNIRHSKDKWQGKAATQTDTDFVQFQTMAYGYRAAWKVLESYWKHFHRIKQYYNVKNIITRWAPPTENDTQAYIRTVLQLSGIDEQENLVSPEMLMSYRSLSKLLGAMTVMENGIRPHQVNTEAIYQGYKMAFPQNAEDLDKWMLGEDEYAEW